MLKSIVIATVEGAARRSNCQLQAGETTYADYAITMTERSAKGWSM